MLDSSHSASIPPDVWRVEVEMRPYLPTYMSFLSHELEVCLLTPFN